METGLFARHAETEYSVRALVNGDPSVPVGLTEAGKEQARALGDALAADPIELCVVTELPRTQETADLALAGWDVPRLVLGDLNDPDYGDFEGGSLAEYRAWVTEHSSREPIPGSPESRLDVIRRYVRGLGTVLERPEATVLCVLHSLPIAYLLGGLEIRDPAPRMAVVGYAEVLRTSAPQLEHAVARLDAWCRAPTW